MSKSAWAISTLAFFQLNTACINQGKAEKKPEAKKPNILFVLVDDQRNDQLSCAGHPIIKTPTVDKLAANGVRFTNAYVTTSICAASRASVFTGLYECRHNFTFGTDPVKKQLINNSYPYLLKKSGYKTGFVGKFGVVLEDQDSIIQDMFDFFRPSGKNAPHFVKQPDGSLRHSAEVCGDRAVEFISQQNPDTPFCLSISFNSVHAVDSNHKPGIKGHYPYPKAVAHLYEEVEMPEPPLSDPEIFENHPDFLKNSLNRERYFWRWDTREKYQTNLRAYYRMISGYDNVIKRVLAALEEKGSDENTVIIFSADNGYYMGNRGFAGKWSHYEESLRVPMIIYDPRNVQSADYVTREELVLNLDIPATILELAGINQPQIYQGESLVPFLKNERTDHWRESFLCEHRMDHEKIPKYVGIHGQRYVYANYYEQEPSYEYLHDLSVDSYQLENFVNHPDYKDILLKMRDECRILENSLKK